MDQRPRRWYLITMAGWRVVGMLVAFVVGAAHAAAPPYQDLARRLVGPEQGVFARAADGTVLAEVAAARPVHPASVSKIPTTLALLRTLGPDHRFVTRVRATGAQAGPVLQGDLVVEGGGDPFLVEEHALMIVARLRERAIREITGSLRVTGDLFFDWDPDPAGVRLRAALVGAPDPAALRRVHAVLPEAGPGIVVRGETSPTNADGRVVVEHRSPSLREVVKALNCYSNNIFHPLSDAVGGPDAVADVARAVVPPAWAGEIRLDNAAGAGTTNRLSPRAAVAIIDALERELQGMALDLTDVLPVSGRDPGTLSDRLDDAGARGAVVGKTGTYGSVGASALAGVIGTRRWGRVTFAVLNRGVAVPEARRRQDAFVRAVLADAGAAPFDYQGPAPSPVLAAETVGR